MIILAILLLCTIANIWVHWIFNPLYIKLIRRFPSLPISPKPLNCEGCMGFWIGLICYFDEGWLKAILIPLICYLVSSLLSRVFVIYLNRLYVKYSGKIKRFWIL